MVYDVCVCSAGAHQFYESWFSASAAPVIDVSKLENKKKKNHIAVFLNKRGNKRQNSKINRIIFRFLKVLGNLVVSFGSDVQIAEPKSH